MAVFDKLARVYDKFMRFWRFYHDSEVVSQLSMSHNCRLVDLGGGNGHYAVRLATICAEVVVADISDKMLKQIPSTDNVKLVCADITNTGLPPDTFDRALISDVLHHMKEPSKAMKESARLLVMGGKIVIHDFNPSHIVTKLLGAFENRVIEQVTYLSIEEITEMMRTCGYGDIQIVVKSYYYVISATKQ